MSSFLKKIQVQIAQKKSNKFDLSCDNLTTQDFFRVKPVYIKEMVPGEKIDINVQTFTRLAPLTRPTLGAARIQNRAFFVPMRTMWRKWNAFITDTAMSNENGTNRAIPQNVPVITNNALVTFMVNNSDVFSGTGEGYDFATNVTTGGTSGTAIVKYKMSNLARRAYDILISLGYHIQYPKNADQFNLLDVQMSALPLISFAKIWYDWYGNSAYVNSEALNSNITSLIYLAESPTTPNYVYNMAVQIKNVVDKIYFTHFDSDYFVSAWDNPVSPNDSSSITDMTVLDTTSNARTSASATDYSNRSMVYTRNEYSSSYAPFNTNGTPTLGRSNSTGTSANNNTPSNVSQYAIDALHRVTDHVMRKRLVGGRVLDRYLAEYGIHLSDAITNRSTYLGKQEVYLNISDVMCTNADSSNTPLGDYAGKGIGFSNDGKFSYKADEFGFIVICSSVEPKTGYVQGRDRSLYHTTRYDYFTPEFDALGTQAIYNSELYADTNRQQDSMSPTIDPKGVFGYLPTYAEYKIGRDRMTGDFAVPSLSQGQDNWHMFRLFNPMADGTDGLTHNYNFTIGSNQYNRIFATSNSTLVDHFITAFHFNVISYAPMATLFDNYDYCDEKDHKKVVMDLNGTTITD